MTYRPNDQSVQLTARAGRAGTDHDRDVPEIDLLSPLTIRDVTFRDRIVMSPMCEYSVRDGFANDWHLVHLGSRAVGGAALIIVEVSQIGPRWKLMARTRSISSFCRTLSIRFAPTFWPLITSSEALQTKRRNRAGTEGGGRRKRPGFFPGLFRREAGSVHNPDATI